MASGLDQLNPWEDSESFLKTAVQNAQLAMIATDLRQTDQPIVFVNTAFETLTGYPADEIIGRNCRFLQGDDTSPETVLAIRETIERKEEGFFEILNYRKDGSAFWNALHLGPVQNSTGTPVIYFGSQRDITKEVEARDLEQRRMNEMRHRLGNLMALVNIIIRNTKREGDTGFYERLQGRMAALGAASELIYPKIKPHHMTAHQTLEPRAVSINEIVQTITNPIGTDAQFIIAGPVVYLTDKVATNVALAIHELATNAAKHGALSVNSGKVEITWQAVDNRLYFNWQEIGVTLKTPPKRQGMGTQLLESMVQESTRADAAMKVGKTGMTCRFDVAVMT